MGKENTGHHYQLLLASCFILKHVLPQMLCFLPLSVALWPPRSALCTSSSTTCSSRSPDLFLLVRDSLSDRWFASPPSRSSDAEYCFSSRSALGFSSLDKPFVFPVMGGTLWRRANEVSMGFFNWFWVGGHPYVLCWYKISFSSLSGHIMKCSVALATD